jgi:hypothetical protein
MPTTTAHPKDLLPSLESLGLVYPRVSPATLVEDFEYAMDTYEADIYLDVISDLSAILADYVKAATPIIEQLAKQRAEQEEE